MSKPIEADHLQRWRLVLGGESAEALPPDLARMDAALAALYDSDRSAGLGASCPNWRAGWATSASISPPPWCR